MRNCNQAIHIKQARLSIRRITSCLAVLFVLAATSPTALAQGADGGQKSAEKSGSSAVPIDSYRRLDPHRKVGPLGKLKRLIEKTVSMTGGLFFGTDDVTHYDHSHDSTVF